MNTFSQKTTMVLRTVMALACAFALVLTSLPMAWAASSTNTLAANAANGSTSGTTSGTTSTSAPAGHTYVLDYYSALSSDQANALESEAAAASGESNIGVYLLIVGDVGSSERRDYAKRYYTSHDLGLGSDKSGILFLISVGSREYVTITYGRGVDAFSDEYISDLEDDVTGYLSDNDWYSGSAAYVKGASTAVKYYAEHGTSYSKPGNPLMAVIVGLIAGIIVAFIVVRSKKAQMKTARLGSEADAYLDHNSFSLGRSDDVYRETVVVCIKSHEEKEAERRAASEHHSVDSSGFGGSSGGRF